MMEHTEANSFSLPLGEIAKDLAVTSESFSDGISMQIIGCGHRLLDVIHGVQLRYYGIFKTSALFTVNVGWIAIHIEPFFH